MTLNRSQSLFPSSLNQDPRSRLHNTEAWIAVDSPELAADLAALFEAGVDSHHAFEVKLNQAEGMGDARGGKTVRHGVEPMTAL